jgi:hypothetical protein
VADSGTGKRLTLAWDTTSANRVTIQSGTAQRPAPAWDVPPDGTITVELPSTEFRDPPVTLWAHSEPDQLSVEQIVSRTINYDESLWEWYPDTWSADQSESDPGIVPPEGLVQPVRGFGKVWRENPEVRERLGWGLAPEQGYNTELQVPIREAFPGAVFVRTFVDGVIELVGWRFGIWRFVAP